MKKIYAGTAIIVLIAVAGFGVWYFLGSSQGNPGSVENVTIGVQPLEALAPIYIARDQGFFARNGLSVTIREYGSGVASVNDMLTGSIDLSAQSDYVVVTNAFNHENFSVIATFDKGDFFYIIGRKDHGITNTSDLEGKKIGLLLGSNEEFYLGRYLDLHGMSVQDVTLVNLGLPQVVTAIEDDNVDAVVAIQPYANTIQDTLDHGVVTWDIQSYQPAYELLAGKNDWISQHTDMVNRVLKSLDMANEYINSHPAEAMDIMRKRLNRSAGYVDTAWQQNQFSLSLDQSLITAMEDQGRWMIANNLTNTSMIPDFRNFIYTKGLQAVKPESVNII
jgi:NitT/TauT family transport system substrate-binding protein